MLAGSELVAADDGRALDCAMLGTMLLIGDPLSAVRVELMEVHGIAGADRRIGLDRHRNQAELSRPLQLARPREPEAAATAESSSDAAAGHEPIAV